jgi:cytosine/adenosine deaminase-related metal-dependent hydrolase
VRYISADIIYPINDAPILNGVIVLNSANEIVDVLKDYSGLDSNNINFIRGSVCPGFINTHCHTELSHLINKIPKHTGLVEFVQQIVKLRSQFSRPEILNAIECADRDMLKNGIVAVGDICNSTDSIEIKKQSKVHYHNFIELIGFNPESASTIFNNGKMLLDAFLENNLTASFSPHAPYSVSNKLMQLIADHESNKTTCIHNQESEAENIFFKFAEGEFLQLYKNFGIDISFHHATGKTSISNYVANLNQVSKIGLVHNTYINKEDLELITQLTPQFYFCSCTKANLFIENKLPPLDLIRNQNKKICLGTDSLASNNELNILSEISTILSNFKSFSLDEVLKWATLNGAEFLGIDNKFGSIEKGKKPGLVFFNENDFKINQVIY